MGDLEVPIYFDATKILKFSCRSRSSISDCLAMFKFMMVLAVSIKDSLSTVRLVTSA